MQETKISTPGKIRTENSTNYEISELNRSSHSGGGFAVGSLKDLEAVWESDGGDAAEILTVEICVGGQRNRCICGSKK